MLYAQPADYSTQMTIQRKRYCTKDEYKKKRWTAVDCFFFIEFLLYLQYLLVRCTNPFYQVLTNAVFFFSFSFLFSFSFSIWLTFAEISILLFLTNRFWIFFHSVSESAIDWSISIDINACCFFKFLICLMRNIFFFGQ